MEWAPVGLVLAAMTGSMVMDKRLKGQGVQPGAKKLGCISFLSAKR